MRPLKGRLRREWDADPKSFDEFFGREASISLTLHLLRESGKWLLVSERPGTQGVFLPKSLCEEGARLPSGKIVLRIPRWLAKEKDLD